MKITTKAGWEWEGAMGTMLPSYVRNSPSLTITLTNREVSQFVTLMDAYSGNTEATDAQSFWKSVKLSAPVSKERREWLDKLAKASRTAESK